MCVRVRDSLVCTGVCVRACTGQFSVHRGVCVCVRACTGQFSVHRGVCACMSETV